MEAAVGWGQRGAADRDAQACKAGPGGQEAGTKCWLWVGYELFVGWLWLSHAPQAGGTYLHREAAARSGVEVWAPSGHWRCGGERPRMRGRCGVKTNGACQGRRGVAVDGQCEGDGGERVSGREGDAGRARARGGCADRVHGQVTGRVHSRLVSCNKG